MNKFTLTVVGISLGITSVISSLFGLAGSTIIGTFWSWFWISFLVQFIGFIIVNSFLIQKDNVVLRQTEMAVLDKLSKFTITLTCAYCKQPNMVPIQLNQRNTFKCEGCNQVNGVSMQFLSTTLTSPIDSVTIPVENSEVEFLVT